MAIYRLLKNSTLEPKEISRITEAYEQALHTLGVKDRDDPCVYRKPSPGLLSEESAKLAR